MNFTNIISTLASFIKDSVEEPDEHRHSDLSPSEQVVFYSMTGVVVIGCCLACCFYKRRASQSRVVRSYDRTSLIPEQDVEAGTQLNMPRAK